MMDYQAFRDKLFQFALQKGCTAAETSFAQGEQFSVHILDQEVDRYTSSRYCGLSLRVQVEGQNGYASTEVFENPEELVRHAMDAARVTESPDENPMQGAQEYQTVTFPPNPVMDMTEREKIELALKAERQVKECDPRITRTTGNVVCTVREHSCLHNTLGLSAEKDETLSYSYIVPVLEADGEVRDGTAFRVGGEMLDLDAYTKEAAKDAALMLGAKQIPSGKYQVILRYDAAADLLEAFSSLFSANMAQKGFSLLAGKEGEVIGSSCLTIIDDPFYLDFPRAFDAEGTPSKTKTVVENGTLLTLLHNLKTAKKAGTVSTSNAANTSGDVAPSNFYIPAGAASYDQLLSHMGDGLVITEVSGLHAGVNAISGDFSLLAKGLLIQGGKPVHPVEQITLSGTFLSLLAGIEEVGSDLKFGIPQGGCVGSPSLRVRSLMVSGT